MRIKVERLLQNGNVGLNLDSGAFCDNNSRKCDSAAIPPIDARPLILAVFRDVASTN